jgi:uncharacterized protein YgiM (DUF1202 family)
MKKNFWLLSAVASLAAISLWAQDTTPAAPTQTPAPSAAATQPAPEPPVKAPRKRATGIKSRVPMNPPATGLVKAGTLNVRGRPSFVGEVLGHVQKDETVTVLEEITLNHPPAHEPPLWYKIVMPTNIPVWLDADYIDASTKSVKARRVNLRGGPGENFSVVGRLEKGAPIEEIRREKGWVSIPAPTNAYGYVAAELVEIQATPAPAPVVEAPAPVAATPTETVPVTTPAAPVAATTEPTPATPVAPVPTDQSQTAQELAALRQATPTEPVAAAAAAPPAATEESAAPRIVTREGFVHRSYNIQAPADYELHDIKTGDLIEYLQPQLPQNFKIYVGTRVTVTGPEVIDHRWPRTPVLQVQSVDLVP